MTETFPAELFRDELCHTMLQVVKEIYTQQMQLSKTIKNMTRGSDTERSSPHTKLLTRDTPKQGHMQNYNCEFKHLQGK